MEFGIEKCVLLMMRSGKRQRKEKNYQIKKELGRSEKRKITNTWELSEADTIKLMEKNEKIRKEYLRRRRKLLETKLNNRNLIKRINTWTVSLVRYSWPFLKWTKQELQ